MVAALLLQVLGKLNRVWGLSLLQVLGKLNRVWGWHCCKYWGNSIECGGWHCCKYWGNSRVWGWHSQYDASLVVSSACWAQVRSWVTDWNCGLANHALARASQGRGRVCSVELDAFTLGCVVWGAASLCQGAVQSRHDQVSLLCVADRGDADYIPSACAPTGLGKLLLRLVKPAEM